MEYKFNALELDSLVTEAVVANSGYAEQYRVKFLFGEMAADTRVKGDAGRLTQVVANLLSNAAKFSPDGGNVTISVTRHDDTARVSIVDKGIGIPQDRGDDIFDKFTQVDASNARAKGGTGLGLNISKSIVEEHGGTIGFESEVGAGSTFYFILPIAR